MCAKEYTITYKSDAIEPLNEEQLSDLLIRIRNKNKILDVTGMLLYQSGSFMQVIEGKKSILIDLYETIRRDVRHDNIVTLYEADIPHKNFKNWSMGFQVLDDAEFKKLHGYSVFLNHALTSPDLNSQSSFGYELLLSFRESLGPDMPSGFSRAGSCPF